MSAGKAIFGVRGGYARTDYRFFDIFVVRDPHKMGLSLVDFRASGPVKWYGTFVEVASLFCNNAHKMIFGMSASVDLDTISKDVKLVMSSAFGWTLP